MMLCNYEQTEPPERAGAERGKGLGAVRLRRPEHRQMAWVAQCPDDLVPAGHAVRGIADVVEHLDVSGFCAPSRLA